MKVLDNRSEWSESRYDELWDAVSNLDDDPEAWYVDSSVRTADIYRRHRHFPLKWFSYGQKEFVVEISENGKEAMIRVICNRQHVDPDAPKKAGYNKPFLVKLSALLEQQKFEVTTYLEDDC